MSELFRIETAAGVVQARNTALAQAVAALCDAEYRASFRDLAEALEMSLKPEVAGGASAGTAAA